MMSTPNEPPKRSVFVVERPLQIIHSIELFNQLGLTNVDFFIADTFHDAAGIAKRLSACFSTLNVELFPTYHDAISAVSNIMYDNLFIHWDVGFGTDKILRRLKNRNPALSISVFEEGVGTYRTDIYPAIKRFIFRIIKLPINVGGSMYVDRIFVHNVNEYIKTSISHPPSVIKINNTLPKSIQYHFSIYLSIFDPDNFISSIGDKIFKRCYIYLSGWSYDDADLPHYYGSGDLNIIKLHPYCKFSASPDRFIVAPAGIPAELIILAAAKQCETVTVLHHGSSSSRYIDSDNVTFLELP